MKSQLLLVCALACFLASQVEGFGLRPGSNKIRNIGKIAIHGALKSKRSGDLFQSVVGIGQFFQTGGPAFCTGSIIHEKFILTSAQCLTTPTEEPIAGDDIGKYASKFDDAWVFVYANTTNVEKDVLESWTKENGTQTLTTRKAVKAYFVPKYFTDGIDDIAIIELESPLNLTDGYHRKLNLPFDRETSYEGVRAELAKFSIKPDVNDRSLTKSHFQVVPYSECKYSISELFSQNGMCLSADTTEKEYDPWRSCNEGLGGPIVDGSTIIGVMTSYPEVTCDERHKYPQISLNVKHYKDFINNVIGNQRPGNNESIAEYLFKA